MKNEGNFDPNVLVPYMFDVQRATFQNAIKAVDEHKDIFDEGDLNVVQIYLWALLGEQLITVCKVHSMLCGNDFNYEQLKELMVEAFRLTKREGGGHAKA